VTDQGTGQGPRRGLTPEHRALREQLGAYVLGGLGAGERAAVDAHLAGCADCRREVAGLAPLAGMLRTVDPARLTDVPAPPPGLGETVLQRVRAERRRPPRWVMPAAAALVVGVLGAGAGFGAGWAAAPDVPVLPLEPVAVEVAQAGLVASADLVPHTWGVEVKLTATGFERGGRYRVTMLGTDGRQVSAGEFVGTGPAQMRCNLNSSLLRDRTAGFRVQDGQGRVVLTSSF
jgi:anti-sigma-K factor RskA